MTTSDITHSLTPSHQMIQEGAKILLKDILDQNIEVPPQMWLEAKEAAEMIWKAMWKQSVRDHHDIRKTTW